MLLGPSNVPNWEDVDQGFMLRLNRCFGLHVPPLNFTVTSTTRGFLHNIEVGGGILSTHLTGQGLDVVFFNLTNPYIFSYCEGIYAKDEGDHWHFHDTTSSGIENILQDPLAFLKRQNPILLALGAYFLYRKVFK